MTRIPHSVSVNEPSRPLHMFLEASRLNYQSMCQFSCIEASAFWTSESSIFILCIFVLYGMNSMLQTRSIEESEISIADCARGSLFCYLSSFVSGFVEKMIFTTPALTMSSDAFSRRLSMTCYILFLSLTSLVCLLLFSMTKSI